MDCRNLHSRILQSGKTFAISADAVASTQDARTAHGYFRSLPTAAEPASTDGLDTSAPEIVEMYVGSPDFRDGDVTGPAPTVYARISVPATGLNINTAPLSGPTRISLDGSDSRSNISGYMQPDGEGFMLLTMPYSALRKDATTSRSRPPTISASPRNAP